MIGELELRSVHWHAMFSVYAFGPSEIATGVDETVSSCAPLQGPLEDGGGAAAGGDTTVGGVKGTVPGTTAGGLGGGAAADADETVASNPIPFTLLSEVNITSATVSVTTTSVPSSVPESDCTRLDPTALEPRYIRTKS